MQPPSPPESDHFPPPLPTAPHSLAQMAVARRGEGDPAEGERRQRSRVDLQKQGSDRRLQTPHVPESRVRPHQRRVRRFDLDRRIDLPRFGRPPASPPPPPRQPPSITPRIFFTNPATGRYPCPISPSAPATTSADTRTAGTESPPPARGTRSRHPAPQSGQRKPPSPFASIRGRKSPHPRPPDRSAAHTPSRANN